LLLKFLIEPANHNHVHLAIWANRPTEMSVAGWREKKLQVKILFEALVLKASRSRRNADRSWSGRKPDGYRRLPDVLAEHAGSTKVLHTLRPFAVAMAGENDLTRSRTNQSGSRTRGPYRAIWIFCVTDNLALHRFANSCDGNDRLGEAKRDQRSTFFETV
jgi:hypothetical protein